MELCGSSSHQIRIFYALTVLTSTVCLIFILNEGQSLTVFLPRSPNATRTVSCLVSLQLSLWVAHSLKIPAGMPRNAHIHGRFPILDAFLGIQVPTGKVASCELPSVPVTSSHITQTARHSLLTPGGLRGAVPFAHTAGFLLKETPLFKKSERAFSFWRCCFPLRRATNRSGA